MHSMRYCVLSMALMPRSNACNEEITDLKMGSKIWFISVRDKRRRFTLTFQSTKILIKPKVHEGVPPFEKAKSQKSNDKKLLCAPQDLKME